MPAFQHILFPVDFSGSCRNVRPFVESIAQRFHSKVTLMHVVQIPAALYGGMDGGYPVMFDVPEMEESAKTGLDGFLEPSKRVADKIIKLGDPAMEITDFAEQNQVDLIMMPTHGYGKFRSLLLGSVTAKVLHDAICPVWTATHTEDPELPKHFECKSIMGAIDVAPASAVLIRRYVEIAHEFNATLRLVQAVPAANTDIHYGMDQDLRTFLIQSARDEIARVQGEAGTNLEVYVEGGPISKIVRAAAQQHNADLVLMGRGTIQETFGQLRTNAYAIIRDAPCPVLSV